MFEDSKNYDKYAESFKRLGVAPFEEMPTIRKKLGDNLHTTVFQDIFFSLLELEPKTYTTYLYSWGKFLSSEATKEAIDVLKMGAQAEIAAKIFHMKILKNEKYTDIVTKPWMHYKMGLPRFEFVDEVAKTFRIVLDDSREAWGLPNIEKKVCFLSSSFFAGSIQAIVGGQVNVFETKCMASGHDHCEFAGATDLPFHKYDVLDSEDLKKIRKSIFDRMFRKDKETRTDWIHLTIPQIFYLGMSLSSSGSHTMFYWIGRKSGAEMKKRIKGKNDNDKLKKLEELLEYLKVGIVEVKKSKNETVFSVKESAFSSGTSNFQKRICSYLAGLFSGFLDGTPVIETKCIAKGDRFCEFKTI